MAPLSEARSTSAGMAALNLSCGRATAALIWASAASSCTQESSGIPSPSTAASKSEASPARSPAPYLWQGFSPSRFWWDLRVSNHPGFLPAEAEHLSSALRSHARRALHPSAAAGAASPGLNVQ